MWVFFYCLCFAVAIEIIISQLLLRDLTRAGKGWGAFLLPKPTPYIGAPPLFIIVLLLHYAHFCWLFNL